MKPRGVKAQIAVFKFLNGGAVKRLENGFCEYVGYWTDASIAARLGVSHSTVATVRKQEWGNLREGQHPTTNKLNELRDELRKEIEQLRKDYDNSTANIERRMQFIEAWARNKGYLVPNGRMQHKEAV